MIVAQHSGPLNANPAGVRYYFVCDRCKHCAPLQPTRAGAAASAREHRRHGRCDYVSAA